MKATQDHGSSMERHIRFSPDHGEGDQGGAGGCTSCTQSSGSTGTCGSPTTRSGSPDWDELDNEIRSMDSPRIDRQALPQGSQLFHQVMVDLMTVSLSENTDSDSSSHGHAAGAHSTKKPRSKRFSVKTAKKPSQLFRGKQSAVFH